MEMILEDQLSFLCNPYSTRYLDSDSRQLCLTQYHIDVSEKTPEKIEVDSQPLVRFVRTEYIMRKKLQNTRIIGKRRAMLTSDCQQDLMNKLN